MNAAIGASTRHLSIDSGHNYQLQANIFEPTRKPLASIIIAPAMGATRDFYYALSQWLAEQGFIVCAFDYHGMDSKSKQQLKNNSLSINEWATQDCAAVIDTMKMLAPSVSLIWIGHSIGGQMVGMIPNRHQVSHFMSIATGTGYWRLNAPPLKRIVPVFWYIIVPLMVKLYGYFPGKRLRMVGDLPRRVTEQWRRWCLNPDYLFGVENEEIREQYQHISMPFTSIYTTDDDMMTVRGIKEFHKHFTGTPVEYIELNAKKLDIQPIDHFGFFRPRYQESLWQTILLPAIKKHLSKPSALNLSVGQTL